MRISYISVLINWFYSSDTETDDAFDRCSYSEVHFFQYISCLQDLIDVWLLITDQGCSAGALPLGGSIIGYFLCRCLAIGFISICFTQLGVYAYCRIVVTIRKLELCGFRGDVGKTCKE